MTLSEQLYDNQPRCKTCGGDPNVHDAMCEGVVMSDERQPDRYSEKEAAANVALDRGESGTRPDTGQPDEVAWDAMEAVQLGGTDDEIIARLLSILRLFAQSIQAELKQERDDLLATAKHDNELVGKYMADAERAEQQITEARTQVEQLTHERDEARAWSNKWESLSAVQDKALQSARTQTVVHPSLREEAPDVASGVDSRLWPACDWCNAELEKFAKQAGKCPKCGALKFEGAREGLRV